MKNLTTPGLIGICFATVVGSAMFTYRVGNVVKQLSPPTEVPQQVIQQPQATNKVYQAQCNYHFPAQGYSFDDPCTVTMKGNNGFEVDGDLGTFSIETTNRPGVVDYIVAFSREKGYKMSSDSNECTTVIQKPDASATVTIRNFCF